MNGTMPGKFRKRTRIEIQHSDCGRKRACKGRDTEKRFQMRSIKTILKLSRGLNRQITNIGY